MQEVEIRSAIDSQCSSSDNNESGQENPNEATSVTIESIQQNEVLFDDASVEPVNLDDHFKEGTDPFVDILAPDDVNSSRNDDTASEDEYIYMSDDHNQDLDVTFENNDRMDYLRRRPGPKSKTRNIQSFLANATTSMAAETVKNDFDGNSRLIVQTSGIERRSTRNATKLKTYDIDSLFAAQIEQSPNLRSKKTQRNPVQFRKVANREENERLEKDLFETPLNAPFIDTSSDEDYFKPINPEPRRNQRRDTNTWVRGWNRLSSDHKFRKKQNHIPDDVYFNPKTPLHVLYSYEGSSSEAEIDQSPAQALFNNVPSSIIPSRNVKHKLRKMPPVHKIEAKKKKQTNNEMMSGTYPAHKPTVFQQLNDLKRMFKASGIKININALVKGSKTFQERCDRIRDCLQQNGIRGRPTLAKCKRLKKQLKAQKKKSDNNELGCDIPNETKQIENSTNESNENLLNAELEKQIIMPTEMELNENRNSIPIDGELKSEENIDPTNLVETILATNESNIDAINQILNSELPTDLIECAVETVDYFDEVRNI